MRISAHFGGLRGSLWEPWEKLLEAKSARDSEKLIFWNLHPVEATARKSRDGGAIEPLRGSFSALRRSIFGIDFRTEKGTKMIPKWSSFPKQREL